MTPEEFKNKMQEAYEKYHEEQDDPEVSHLKMDDIMVETLRELGYGEGVDVFEKSTRWYA